MYIVLKWVIFCFGMYCDAPPLLVDILNKQANKQSKQFWTLTLACTLKSATCNEAREDTLKMKKKTRKKMDIAYVPIFSFSVSSQDAYVLTHFYE